jgi:hypothetical protein
VLRVKRIDACSVPVQLNDRLELDQHRILRATFMPLARVEAADTFVAALRFLRPLLQQVNQVSATFEAAGLGRAD